MLSKILVDYLNNFFGEYFHLDSSQLNMSIWRGDVLLTDLYLKTSALDNYYLPFKIIAGKVGKVIMQIPWRNIYSLPVEITLKDCEVLLTPSLDMPYDPEKEEEDEYVRKIKNLESSLARAKLEGLSIDSMPESVGQSHEHGENPSANSPSSSAFSGNPIIPHVSTVQNGGTFVEKLFMHVVRNIQVKVEGVHIRYEDKISNPKMPFSLGILLNTLDIQTKDTNWNQLYITENMHVGTFNKLIEVIDFSVYMNSNVNLISAVERSPTEIFTLMKQVNEIENPHMNNAIGPVSAEARLTMSPSPELLQPPFSLPKLTVQIDMNELKLRVANHQCENFYRILETTEFISRARIWRKYRPENLNSYKGFYRQWWNYAYTCVVEKIRARRSSWGYQNMLNHRNLCKTYFNACYEKQIQKKSSPELDEKLKECEKQLDLFNLFLIRTRIEMIQKKHQQVENELKSQQSWFRKWFGVDITEAEIASKVEESLTPEEKIKLNQAIGFNNPNTKNQVNVTKNIPPDYFSVKVKFRLNVTDVVILYLPKRLFNSGVSEREILLFKIYDVDISTNVRPDDSGFTFICNVSDIGAETIIGSMNQQSVLEKIICGTNLETNKQLLELVFEKSRMSSGLVEKKLKANTSKVEIVYYPSVAKELMNCFHVPKGVELNMMRSNLMTRIQEMKETSSAKIKELVESNTDRVYFEMNIAAPFFIIPQRGRLDENVRALIVDFGQIELRSVPVTKENRSQGATPSSSSKMNLFYPTMKLTLSNFQVLLITPASPQLFNFPASENSEGISADGIKSFWKGLVGNVRKSITNFYKNKVDSNSSTTEFHHNNQNLIEVVPSVTVEATVVKSSQSGANYCKINISDIFVRLSAWDFGFIFS